MSGKKRPGKPKVPKVSTYMVASRDRVYGGGHDIFFPPNIL